jgi:hypothetical protein
MELLVPLKIRKEKSDLNSYLISRYYWKSSTSTLVIKAPAKKHYILRFY